MAPRNRVLARGLQAGAVIVLNAPRTILPAAALFYPWALTAFYQSAQMLARANGTAERIAGGFSIAVALALVIATPVLAYICARDCIAAQPLSSRRSIKPDAPRFHHRVRVRFTVATLVPNSAAM